MASGQHNQSWLVTNGYERATCHQDSAGSSAIEIAATTVGVFIGFSNLLIVIVIMRNKKLHKGTFFCICNLAIADFLAGLLLLWIFFLQKIILTYRTPESELIQKSTWAVTVWSSMLNQLVIAIDRFFCIRSRRGFQNDTWGGKKRKGWLISGLVLTWMIPILTFTLPVAVSWNCLEGCGCYKPLNSSHNIYYIYCQPINKCSLTNPPFTKASMLYMGLVLILIPIVPSVLYTKIFKMVRSSSKRIKEAYSKTSITHNAGEAEANFLSKKQTSEKEKSKPKFASCLSDSHFATTSESNDPSIQSCQKVENLTVYKKSSKSKIFLLHYFKPKNLSGIPKYVSNQNLKRESLKPHSVLRKISSTSTSRFSSKSKRREMALLRTLVIILALYLISTLPLGIVFIISFGETDKRNLSTAKVVLIISLFNSAINPIIYMWRFKELRKSIKRLFCLKEK